MRHGTKSANARQQRKTGNSEDNQALQNGGYKIRLSNIYSTGARQDLCSGDKSLSREPRVSLERLLQMAFNAHLISSGSIQKLNSVANVYPHIGDHANILIGQLLVRGGFAPNVLQLGFWIMCPELNKRRKHEARILIHRRVKKTVKAEMCTFPHMTMDTQLFYMFDLNARLPIL